MPQTESAHKPQTTLGRRIKSRRALWGWTQAQLAERTGLHPTTIAFLESGRMSNPTMATLGALARALSTTTDWLATGEGAESVAA